MLSRDERTILFQFCSNHSVAYCRPCAGTYRLTELAADFVPLRANLCRVCRADLSESMRNHLRTCPHANGHGRMM
jgi:hypothetical protein